MNISQQDLDVRLQLIGCKFGDLANNFANNLRFGRRCSIESKRNLALLNIYLDLLECYNVIQDEVLSNGIIQISRLTLNDTVNFIVNGISISGIVTINSTSINTFVVTLANAINSYQTNYIATVNTSTQTHYITLVGTCNNYDLDYQTNIGATSTFITTGFINGKCEVKDEDNCITQDQAKKILDNISKLTNICFQTYGFDYTPN